MTKELTLRVTDLERKVIVFCREKDISFPIANYLVEFAKEATKELQGENDELQKKNSDLENKLANVSYQLEGREIELKELQEEIEKKESDFRKFKADYQELCLLKDMRIDDKDKQIAELKNQIEKMKADVKAIHFKNDFTKSPYQNMVDKGKAISELIKNWS